MLMASKMNNGLQIIEEVEDSESEQQQLPQNRRSFPVG